MRTMKKNNNETVMVIGIDHGYGNMKTATRCFLCSYPGKWKSGCNVYLCPVHTFPIQFPCDSRQCQHIIVLVLRFLCTELLVFLSDLVIHVIVNKKIIRKKSSIS